MCCHVVVREVVSVPYVGAVVAVTVMHVLLFVLHMSMVRDCDGSRVTAMLVWETGEVVASAGHEHMCGKRCSAIVSRSAYMLGVSVWDERSWWSV